MIKNIIKYIIIYSYKEKSEKRRWIIKREIIKYLELLNIRINKWVKRIIISRKRLLSRINRLEKKNHINDYKLISYNFNKNSMIIKSILSKLIINLLENVINGVDLKSGKSKISGGNIIISKPVIKENLNTVNILFYYFLPNNKSYKYFNRINMYLNKHIKNYKKLVKLNKNYSKSSYLLQDKLIISNIFNNIIFNRNNIKYINNNVNNLISSLNMNSNNKSLYLSLLNKTLNNNLSNLYSNNNINKSIINNTLVNISILNNNNNNNNTLFNINNNLFNLLNLLNNYINNNNYNNIISNTNILLNNYNNNNNNNNNNKCNIHSKIKLERKNIILNYLLKNEIINKNQMWISKIENNKINNINNNNNNNILKINKENDKTNIFGYMISYIDILLGNIINKSKKSNDIKMIISKYFGLKEVNITGINLKYEFNNTEILLKLIRKGISKRKRTLSRIFRFRLKNRIPLLNDKGILKNKISNNLLKNLALNNNILNVEYNIKNVLFNSINNNNINNNNNNNIYNDIKDYYNNISLENKKDLSLNNELLYKNIVGWSLLLKGKVGARKGKNRSNRILMTKGSFKNNNLYIYNIFDDNSNNNGYTKDRLRLNYIKNSNFISYMDKSTNNGKLGITLKVNIL